MQVTEQDLRERYAGMETEQLLASLASPPQRFTAQFIDSIVTLLIFIPAMLVAPAVRSLGIAGFILAVAYLLLADGLPNGQSIGKRVLNIAVIDMRTRKPCTYFQSFGRNFLLALLGIFDWILIFGRKHQRLGDMLASTIVVRLPHSAAAAVGS